MNNTSLIYTFKNEFSSSHVMISTFLVALIYFIVAILLINFQEIINVLANQYSFSTTITIFISLLPQTVRILSFYSFVSLLLIAFLFSLNIQLVLKSIGILSQQKNLTVTVSTGLISVISAGCSACSLSLLSILGLSSAIAILPFQGQELALLSIVLLSVTLYYNLDSINKSCTIPPTTS